MSQVTHYFVYVGHSTQTKNKLQHEFKSYLESLSGMLVGEAFYSDLTKQIKTKSEELNQKHNRCQSLKIGFSELYSKKGSRIDGFYSLTFEILDACLNNPLL